MICLAGYSIHSQTSHRLSQRNSSTSQYPVLSHAQPQYFYSSKSISYQPYNLIPMQLGAAIRTIRKKTSLSQKELADLCEISQTALSQIEVGIKQPSRRTIHKICKELDISEFIIFMLAMETTDICASRRRAYTVVFPILQDLLLQIVLPADHFRLDEPEPALAKS